MCGIESRERRGQGWSQSCRPRPVLVIARLDTDDIQAHIFYENRQRENNAFLIMLIQLLANDAVQLIGKKYHPPPLFVCVCLVVVAGQLQSSPNTFQQHLTECVKGGGGKNKLDRYPPVGYAARIKTDQSRVIISKHEGRQEELSLCRMRLWIDKMHTPDVQ